MIDLASERWTAKVKDTQIGHCYVIDPINACLYVDHQYLPHDAANRESVDAKRRADLIAAAPDLLAAAKAARDALGSHGPCKDNSCRDCRRAWDLIRSAIAKAEGGGA